VLVLLFRDDCGELRLVLVARGPLRVHGGQIGLPGGKREPSDAWLLETALRETEEELGLGRSEIDVVAALDPIDTRTTGIRVQPFQARPNRGTLTASGLTTNTRSGASLYACLTRCSLDCSPTSGRSEGRWGALETSRNELAQGDPSENSDSQPISLATTVAKPRRRTRGSALAE